MYRLHVGKTKFDYYLLVWKCCDSPELKSHICWFICFNSFYLSFIHLCQFQAFFPICWFPWSTSLQAHPSWIWDFLWEVREWGTRHGNYTRLETSVLWPCRGGSSILCTRHAGSQTGNLQTIHNHQQTRPRLPYIPYLFLFYDFISARNVVTVILPLYLYVLFNDPCAAPILNIGLSVMIYYVSFVNKMLL